MRRLLTALIALAVAGVAGSAGAQSTVKSGTIASSETWGVAPNPCPILLDGPVAVGDGTKGGEPVVLTILPGCVVRGQGRSAAGSAGAPGSLIITRQGALEAQGLPTSPIIFTTAALDLNSDNVPDRTGAFLNQATGATLESQYWDDTPTTVPSAPLAADGTAAVQLWGGLVILGEAPVNVGNGSDCAGLSGSLLGECTVEGIELPGDVDSLQASYGNSANPLVHDYSGTMRFIQVKHGGDQIGTANEINGVTLAGVGDATVFEFIEVFANFDDGMEWFGGTVNGNNLMVTFAGDDSFDTDQGYTGVNEDLFAIMPFFGETDNIGTFGSDSGDKAGELDGDDFNDADKGITADCRPKSNFRFANWTTFGSGLVTSPDFTPTGVAGVGNNRGVQFRNGAGGMLVNAIVNNPIGQGIDVDDNTSDGCTGFSTAEQIDGTGTPEACTTEVLSSTFQGGSGGQNATELALLACGDADTRTSALGVNRLNTIGATFGNADTSFDPTGDSANKLSAGLKSAPIDPRPGGLGAIGGTIPLGTSSTRGGFIAGQPLWTDGWTVLDLAGLL